MPLMLDAVEEKTITIDTLEINSHAVDHEQNEIHIVYDEGYVDTDGKFIPVNMDRMLRLTPPETLAAITQAEGFSQGGDDVYTSIKKALYEAIKSRTKITGTVI